MKNTNKSKIKAIDKEHLLKLIKDEIQLNGNDCDLNFIDTSDITDMSYLFYSSKFNGNISKWNTSNVTNMSYMFSSSEFNGNINDWDISNVVNMKCMFFNSKFNKNIFKWNTSNIIDMSYMFAKSNFNKNLSDWNVTNVINFSGIFNESKLNNIPYWAKLNNANERIKAYKEYHAQKEKDLILNKINENSDLIIKHNKNNIKI